MKDIKKIITSLNIGALFITYDTYFKALLREQNENLANSNSLSQISNMERTAGHLNTQSSKLEQIQNKPNFLSKEVYERLEYIDSTHRLAKESNKCISNNKDSLDTVVAKPGIAENPKVQEAFLNMDKAEKALKSGQEQMDQLLELNNKSSGSDSNKKISLNYY